MKKFINKLLIVILIVFIINNFLISSFSQVSYAGFVEDTIAGLLESVIGIFTYIPKVGAVGLAFAAEELIDQIAYSQGTVENGNINPSGTPTSGFGGITPFDIFFNKMALTDINFFNFNGLSEDNIIYKIRSSVAGWYYVMRAIAAAILLAVLVYIGIRMALSTIAQDRALYKKMLVDWVSSLALIFLLHYIAIFTINANNAIVKMMAGLDGGDTMTAMRNTLTDIRNKALGGISMNSMAAAVVYCMTVAQTFALLISYFNRMLKIAFLLIIAPLITLTYSIDKIGDGKAQALGNWLKEFVYTVLIQPFHCIIYLSFISIAFNIIKAGDEYSTIAGSVMAILCLRFTKEAENIIRSIFGFKDDNANTSLAGGMAMSAMALGAAKNIGKGTRTAVNKLSSMPDTFKNMSRNAAATRMALTGAVMDRVRGRENTNDDGNTETFADRRQKALDALSTEETAKKMMKENKKYGMKAPTSQEIKAKAAEIMQQEGGAINKSQAMARARLSIAKENRKKIVDNNGGKMPEIKGVRGALHKASSGIRAVHNFTSRSQVVQMVKKAGLAGGAAIFTGAVAYGTGSNLSTAVTSGMAAYKGGAEFMSNSKKTLTNDVNDRMQSLGVAAGFDEEERIDEIMAKGNAEGYDDDAFKEVRKQIEKALKDAGVDKSRVATLRHSMQNQVNHALSENPAANSGNIVLQALNDSLNKEGISLNQEGRQNVGEALLGFATMKQEASIFQTISTAAELGIDPNKFARDAVKSYTYQGRSATPVFSEFGQTEGQNSLIRQQRQLQRDKDELEAKKQNLERLQRDAEAQSRGEQVVNNIEINIFEGLTEPEKEALKQELQRQLDAVNGEIDAVNNRIHTVQLAIERIDLENEQRRNSPNDDEEDDEEENQ